MSDNWWDNAPLVQTQQQPAPQADDWWKAAPLVQEPAKGGVLQTIDGVVRQVAKGIPVLGGAMDSVAAAGDAATYPLLGRGAEGGNFSERYARNLTSEQAKDASFEKQNPITSTAANVTGAVAGTLPMAATAVGARALGLVGSMPARIAQGAAGGAAIGAADSTLRDQSATMGSVVGGVLGGASPIAGRAIGAGVEKAAEYLAPVAAPVAGYARGAVSKVSRAVADDAVDPAALQRLGPEGMIADAGTNLTSQAGALANQPGPGQRVVVEALTSRRLDAPGRIQSDVTQALGPRVNVIEAEQAIRKKYGEAAKPLYDEFRASPVPYTEELEGLANKLQAQPDVLRKARQFATLDDTADPKQFFANIADDGTVTMQRVPNASEWDYIKRALDDYGRNAKPGTNEQRIYGGLATKVRDAIDGAISPADPSASVYAQARKVAGEGIGLRNTLDEGQGAFSRGVSPDQMRADIKGMSSAEKIMYSLGARNQVADVMGNSATSFGPNGDTAARRALGSDFAREKLGLIAGDEAAGRLTNRLDAESAFERTRQAVTQNSKTASRLQAQKEFPNSVEPTSTSMANPTILGLVELLGRKSIDGLRTSGKQSKLEREGLDAARMLTEQGVTRDKLLQALQTISQRNAAVKPVADGAQDIATLLMQSQSEPLRLKIGAR